MKSLVALLISSVMVTTTAPKIPPMEITFSDPCSEYITVGVYVDPSGAVYTDLIDNRPMVLLASTMPEYCLEYIQYCFTDPFGRGASTCLYLYHDMFGKPSMSVQPVKVEVGDFEGKNLLMSIDPLNDVPRPDWRTDHRSLNPSGDVL